MLKNPLLPAGADPFSVFHEGWYYYTHTTFDNVTLWRTRDLADLSESQSRVIWRPEKRTAHSRHLWAPEIHWIGDRWFCYFAADNGRNRNHRMYVLQGLGQDPFEADWTFLGPVTTPEARWSIDGTVLQHRGAMYFLWSGWEGAENGQQNIYIAKMENPWTIAGERVLLSSPEHPWERHGTLRRPRVDDKPLVLVNEGPSVLVRNGRIFVIYSASGSWTEYYALGMIWADENSDLLDPASWHKRPAPVFRAFGNNARGTYAAGHNSFFQSPDGTEDWILYHANSRKTLGWGNRSPRAQRFTWTSDGFPCFDAPVAAGVRLQRPSTLATGSGPLPGSLPTPCPPQPIFPDWPGRGIAADAVESIPA